MTAPNQTVLKKEIAWWFVVLVVTALVTIFVFKHVDAPLARLLRPFSTDLMDLGKQLGSALLLTLESAVVTGLVIYRLAKGSLPLPAKTVAVACFASIAAYAINAGVLKMVFGVVVPREMFGGAHHVINFFQGSYENSFPSGHMVLASGFSGAVIRLYRWTILPLAGLLALAAALLLLGNFHFLSDIIAGTFVGLTAGLLAGEILIAHQRTLTGGS